MTPADDATFFGGLRTSEFARLDAQDCAYLDYTGSALHAASQSRAYAALLADGLFGNPHSAHGPSLASSACIASARRRLLAWFGVGEDSHVVCFVANASAAIRLVAEAYAFSPTRGLALSADNHNSVNGIRAYARRAAAPVDLLPLDAALRLEEPQARLCELPGHGGLLAFPAQSNFSGVRHPLGLVAQAQSLGWDVLLDAAAYVPTQRLDLRRCSAQFVALSFYKMFGLPTGLGALIARRDALSALRRPWFAGGTVEYASVQLERHLLRDGAEGFEDGTADFLGIAALDAGFDVLERIGADRLSRRVDALASDFVAALRGLSHANGAPQVRLHGPSARSDCGATIAFNLLDRDGRVMPHIDVETRARGAGVALRGGCFCNPGASEAAFGFPAARSGDCLDRLGTHFSVDGFSRCLGGAVAVGALRASMGAATVDRDLERAVELLAACADHPLPAITRTTSIAAA